MKLFLTPLSHFSRKVRILTDIYSLPVEYVDVGNVAEIGVEKFAGNPLMGVPVLTDDDLWLIDSDHILAYLIKKYCQKDEFQFFSDDPKSLNIRAILNGVMSNEVKLIIGKRTGISVHEYKFFEKAKLSIIKSLNWLEKNIDEPNENKLTFNHIHATCAIDHLSYFETIDLTSYKRLHNISEFTNKNPKIYQSNPFQLRPK